MKEHSLSQLARSNNYQLIYKEYKKGRLQLFVNNVDLSEIQLNFLRWLELFSVIYKDIAEEAPCAFKDLVKDPMRVQAYIIYKSRRIKKENKKSGNNKNNKTTEEKIIFTR